MILFLCIFLGFLYLKQRKKSADAFASFGNHAQPSMPINIKLYVAIGVGRTLKSTQYRQSRHIIKHYIYPIHCIMIHSAVCTFKKYFLTWSSLVRSKHNINLLLDLRHTTSSIVSYTESRFWLFLLLLFLIFKSAKVWEKYSWSGILRTATTTKTW